MIMPLNFCMITTFYPPYNFGGDGIFVYRLSNELARQGHYVHIIHSLDAYQVLNFKDPDGLFPNHSNITVHGLKSKTGFLTAFLTHQTGYPLFNGKRIRRILNENDFDVIHFHNISLVGGPGILRYGKGIKLYTTHEHWLLCPLSVLWKFNKTACIKKRCLLCTIHAGRPPQFWRYGRIQERMVNNIDAFISPSQFTIKKHHEMGLNLPFVHIPNFLTYTDENETGEKAGAASTSRPYFLFVGRIEKSKGLHNLIMVFMQYTKSDLLIAGEGPQKRALCELAKGVKNIKFIGHKSFEELKKIYKDAIAVIVPSLCYETFCMVILEAFAMQTPVVVNNTGALPEIVNQSRGGFIYNNDAELLKCIESLAINPVLRKELGANGYSAYKKYWTEESYFEKYFSLIYEIADKKRLNFQQ